MPITTTKPTMPSKSLESRINEFIGAAEGNQTKRKQVIDSATNQNYVKFLLEILEPERDLLKKTARSLNMGMNEFIIEAIREKLEKIDAA